MPEQPRGPRTPHAPHPRVSAASALLSTGSAFVSTPVCSDRDVGRTTAAGNSGGQNVRDGDGESTPARKGGGGRKSDGEQLGASATTGGSAVNCQSMGSNLRTVAFNYNAVPLYAASIGEERLRLYSSLLAEFADSKDHAEFMSLVRFDAGTSPDVLLDMALCSFVHTCYKQRPREDGVSACTQLYEAIVHRNVFLSGKLTMTLSSLRSWLEMLESRRDS